MGEFTGGFIDPDDADAMEWWARGMCKGVDFEEAAKTLNVPPTITDVAKELMGNNSENKSIRDMTVKVCEEELRIARKEG